VLAGTGVFPSTGLGAAQPEGQLTFYAMKNEN
jgi:hypothetical protein